MHKQPIPPYPAGTPLWPPRRFSTISKQKMNQFLTGHIKYYTKGKKKVEDVEQKFREELVEYNVARRLRGSETEAVRNHMYRMSMGRAGLDLVLGMNIILLNLSHNL